jgi:uncharacterized LabA/DUF88 family protein
MSNNVFGLVPERKTYVAIDGVNLHAALRNEEGTIDFKKMREDCEIECDYINFGYFTGVADDEDGHNPIKPLIDFLSFNGFELHTKPLNKFTTNDGRTIVKGNTDVDLAVKVMEMAWNGACEHLVLFSGNNEFSPLVKALRSRGIRVSIVSGEGVVGESLRASANEFINVKEVLADFKR